MISTLALAVNLLLLVALLSMLQATLTLPGIAAIALTLGMAIDANVLINERIREELRNGTTPQAAIYAGYERAWATILDSNVTTLIAGLALLTFGSGPVRGFAVVHCLGILTSMFSAVMVSRGLVNLLYGRAEAARRASRSARSGSPAAAKCTAADQLIAHERDRKPTWNSSGSSATSRSCGMRWCSTSISVRHLPARGVLPGRRAGCTSASSSPAAR